jgi:hypothetical protein
LGADCKEWKSEGIASFYNRIGNSEMMRISKEAGLGDINKLTGEQLKALAVVLKGMDKDSKLVEKKDPFF